MCLIDKFSVDRGSTVLIIFSKMRICIRETRLENVMYMKKYTYM